MPYKLIIHRRQDYPVILSSHVLKIRSQLVRTLLQDTKMACRQIWSWLLEQASQSFCHIATGTRMDALSTKLDSTRLVKILRVWIPQETGPQSVCPDCRTNTVISLHYILIYNGASAKLPMVSRCGRRLKYICLSICLSLAWSHFSPVVNNHFSPVVNQSCPASLCKTLSFVKYNNESLGHSTQDQAISDRTLWKNLLRVLVGELWMCLLAIWSAQIFKRKLSFLVGLGLFHLLSPPLQTVVALRPVAAVRGSSQKFPAFLEWKRYLSRQHL